MWYWRSQTRTITTEKIYVSSVERLLRAVYSKHTHKHYNINPQDIENLKHCKVRKDLISNPWVIFAYVLAPC